MRVLPSSASPSRRTEKQAIPRRESPLRLKDSAPFPPLQTPQGAAASPWRWGPLAPPPRPPLGRRLPCEQPTRVNSVIRLGLLTLDIWYIGCKEVNFQNFILMPSDEMRGNIRHRGQIAAEELRAKGPKSDLLDSVLRRGCHRN